MAIIILQIFYSENFPTSIGKIGANNWFGFARQPWISSCLYIFIEQVVFYFLFLFFSHGGCKPKPVEQDRKELKAWNVYMDFTVSIKRALLTFAMQFSLILVYVWVMNGMSTIGASKEMRTINPE